MSHYETTEQRNIRELRSNIYSMERTIDAQAERNRELQRQLDEARRQQREENERLTQLMQQQNVARRQREQMSDRIRQLDGEVKSREALQTQKIRAMENLHAAQMQQLHEQLENENRTIRGEISHTRIEMQQGLAQTREEMQQGFNNIRQETDQKLQQQHEETQRTLQQLDNRLQRKLREVDSKVASLAQQIAEKEQGDFELAVYWAQEAARMLSQIRETFPPAILSGVNLSRLARGIDNANDSIRSGQYQASIASGRNAFFDALDMKEDLAQAFFEWNNWFNAVKETEAQLLEALKEAKNRIYEVDVEGEPKPLVYSNGIDYWTYGQLSIVERQISDLRSSLQNADSMTADQLRSIFNKLRALQEQLALVENTAQDNIAMSLSRYETASKIGGILGDNYNMKDADGDYFSREDREEYHAIFENPVTGDQAAVVITPIPDERTGRVVNHIDLIIGNADNNPVTRDRMTTAVAEQLRHSGVEDCSFPCASRFQDQTGQEVSRVGDIAAVEAGDEKARASIPRQTSAFNPSSTGNRIRRSTIQNDNRR